MSKLDNYVAGMFRRNPPQGDQFDILVAWIALKLADGIPPGGNVMNELAAAINRGTKHLSKQSNQ
jgi:hypothetical protein